MHAFGRQAQCCKARPAWLQGVLLTHASTLAVVGSVKLFLNSLEGMVMNEKDVYMSFLPLAHIFDRYILCCGHMSGAVLCYVVSCVPSRPVLCCPVMSCAVCSRGVAVLVRLHAVRTVCLVAVEALCRGRLGDRG